METVVVRKLVAPSESITATPTVTGLPSLPAGSVIPDSTGLLDGRFMNTRLVPDEPLRADT